MNAVVRLNTFQGIGRKRGEGTVLVGPEVDEAATPCIGSQTIGGEIDGRGVHEGEEMRHAALLSQVQEMALSLLPAPVPRAVLTHETLSARAGLDLRGVALFG